MYALVNEKWVLVKIENRRTQWVCLSFTYRYDVLQGETRLRDIPQSDIMTMEDYNKERSKRGRVRNAEQ